MMGYRDLPILLLLRYYNGQLELEYSFYTMISIYTQNLSDFRFSEIFSETNVYF